MFQILKEFYLYYYLTINVQWRIALFVGIVLFAIVMYCYYKKHLMSKACAIITVILLSWIWFVLISTVLGRQQIYKSPQYNLKLFWEYFGIFFSKTTYVKLIYVRGVAYNIFMLLPVGLFLPISINRKNIWICIVLGLIVSVSIEALQLITMRGLFELDDIINNIVGVLIGYWIYKMVDGRYEGGK